MATPVDRRAAFIAAAEADLAAPLLPAPTLDTIENAHAVGYEHGYLDGIRYAVDEAAARRLLAMATGGRL